MNLKELANLLGLSQTTVSRALGGYAEVSEQTRRRVRLAADQNNYQPNTRAKSLATGRAMAIGHVISMTAKNEVVNPIFGEFIAGASEIYTRNGYEIVLTIARDEDENRIYRELKAKKSVDGVIVHSPQGDDSRIGLLQEIGLPFVVHGRVAGDNSRHAWVDVNNKRAFHHATLFLADLGHRRISLINGLESLNFAVQRRQGYLSALASRGLTVDAGLMTSEELTEQYGYRAASGLLASAHPPSAFLVSSYIVALGVRRAISDRGLKMGDDVSVVTHDDELSYFSGQEDTPQFTATRSSVREAGRRAAALLLEMIRNPGEPPRHELLTAELIVGLSTGPWRRPGGS